MSEQQLTMYPVKIPNGLMDHIGGTGLMEGSDKSEPPYVKAELESLRQPKGKAAYGEVSLVTLGWIAVIARAYLDFPDLTPSAARAASDALQRYEDAYYEGEKAEAANQPQGVQVDGVTVPASFGHPLYHVRDADRLIGFRTPNNGFVAVEDVKAELEKAAEGNLSKGQ
ncbi:MULTISPECIES: hypothetical protein [Streptomyces]|uniref:Uncharacterized protein n=2 Tax=Streptomyces TaxID=1883 RepID=A0ABV9ISJ8_9ACTN